MRKTILWTVLLLSVVFSGSYSMPAQKAAGAADNLSAEIIAMERSAIDRWITGDPEGYLSIYAPEMTYFDPAQEKRVDGLEALKTLFAPMKTAKRQIREPRYEMIDPKVQRHGDVALLTFNVINYGKRPNQPETVLARWNVTEVYSRMDGKWKIIHGHFSFIKPEIKRAT